MYTENKSSTDRNKNLLHDKNCAFFNGCHRFHGTSEIQLFSEIP